jgi:hypothetical protein
VLEIAIAVTAGLYPLLLVGPGAWRRWQQIRKDHKHDGKFLKTYSDKDFDQMPRATIAQQNAATEAFVDGQVERGVREYEQGCFFGEFNREFIITIAPDEPDSEMVDMASMVTGNHQSYEFLSLYRLYRNQAWKRFRLTLAPLGKIAKAIAEEGARGAEEEAPWYKGIFEERRA